MQSTIQVLRAITAGYIRQFFMPMLRVFTIISIVVLGVGVFLGTKLNRWWFVLAGLSVVCIGVVVAFRLLLRFITNRVNPTRLSVEDKRAVDRFVQDFNAVIGTAKQPIPQTMFQIVFATIRGKGAETVRSHIDGSRQLTKDFQKLRERLQTPSTK